MSNKITIWTLNDTAKLLHTHQNEIKELFKKHGYNAEFGNRVYEEKDDIPINLMPDIEYFVPVVPKCIGDLFDKEPPAIVQNIFQYYKKTGQDDYKKFWEFNGRNYKMLTEQYKGYYSILRETKPNFLIGYSQGGVVARYLLWLATKVYNEPGIIKGVITLASPNFGSPLANPANKDEITRGLFDIIAVFLDSKKKEGKVTRSLRSHLSLDDISGLLQKVTETIDTEKKARSLDRKKQRKLTNLNDILKEFFNWLGGLKDDPNNAFRDLNIFHMNTPETEYSVLSSIHQSNPDKKIRSIITVNNSLIDLLKDVFPLLMEMVIDVIGNYIKNNTKLDTVIDNNALMALKDKKLSCLGIACKIKEIEKIINNRIMMEHPAEEIKNPVIRQRIDNYCKGMWLPWIKSKAHDFLIPSVYQLTVKGKTIPPVFNLPNSKANHISGSRLEYKAGQKNYNNIVKLLKKMLKEGL